MKEEYKLSHLKELEAESIHIIREVAAEFENPVMLYSIGKDSSVMVRLAEKAFAPGKVPFPLMHIDSKWKFKEMIQFRDEYAKKYGWNLIVESNMEAFQAGVGPFTHGSKVHTDLMKTQALLHALDKYKFDAAFGGARRDEEKSRAKERIGRLPVVVPAGVTVEVKENNYVVVKGSKGTLERNLPVEMDIKVEDGHVVVTRPNDLKKMKADRKSTRLNSSHAT